jgi:N-acetyl-anhydromuramyl-L-alanine amidase AmpD
MTGSRHHPKVTVRHNVACQSTRHGESPLLIVLHDTEGGNIPHSSRDLAGLGDYFDRLSTQASSHVAVDEDGHSARYVPDGMKAWSQAYYNPWCLSIEQIGFATDDWKSKKKEAQLQETARWIAWWSKEHNIPIQAGTVTSDGRITKPGVKQHRSLGSLGGGHHDVARSYPTARVLAYARVHRRAL